MGSLRVAAMAKISTIFFVCSNNGEVRVLFVVVVSFELFFLEQRRSERTFFCILNEVELYCIRIYVAVAFVDSDVGVICCGW